MSLATFSYRASSALLNPKLFLKDFFSLYLPNKDQLKIYQFQSQLSKNPNLCAPHSYFSKILNFESDKQRNTANKTMTQKPHNAWG